MIELRNTSTSRSRSWGWYDVAKPEVLCNPADGFIEDDWLTFVAHMWINEVPKQQTTRVGEPLHLTTTNHKVPPRRRYQNGILKESALFVLPMNRLLDSYMEKGECLNCICLPFSDKETAFLVLISVSAPTVAGCSATEDPHVRSVKPT